MRCYFSHPIQGKKGKDATREDMDVNNKRAIVAAKQIRSWYPGIDFYVPAEHDEFVIEAYTQSSLTVEQILEADKAIVRKCDLLVAYMADDYLSGGMIKEVIEACDNRIPVFFWIESRGLLETTRQITSWLTEKMR
jgi:hypothetical protein